MARRDQLPGQYRLRLEYAVGAVAILALASTTELTLIDFHFEFATQKRRCAGGRACRRQSA